MRVLILCTGNSARSQMAEAILRQATRGRITVDSAGTVPQPEIHQLEEVNNDHRRVRRARRVVFFRSG